LDKNANLHVKALRSGDIIVNKEALTNFLKTIHYPVFFIDFEIFMPAIPLYDHTKPYQHIPFQYSIHYKKNKQDKATHVDFLADAGIDPRRQFIESFLKDTEAPGAILVYDTLNALKKEFPEYQVQISQRIARFVDLMKPFHERHYYHPAMNNSCSIKSILNAMVPDLNYNTLSIQSGSVAMAAFENLQYETDIFKILETRENLLSYCQLDTLAMLKVFEILEDVTG
jgi:hypothetical protein